MLKSGQLCRRANNLRQYYGLNGLDQKLEKYLGFDGGFFVELGANNGIDQSNTLYYEKFRNWHGVLIEPIPHNYLLCRQNRSTMNTIFCNACVSFEYKDKFVEIIYSNLMSTPIGLESDISNPQAHASEGLRHIPSTHDNFTFGARASTLEDLLVKANAPALIDFLSLDVEGAEIEVLKGIDFNRHKFRFMCIESRDLLKIATHLARHDYHLIDKLSQHDYVFTSDRNLLLKSV